MAVTLLRSADHAWLPSADGQGRAIQQHNSGETVLDYSIVSTVFPAPQVGMARLNAATNAMQLGNINSTSGGGTGSFAATTLNIAAYLQFSGTVDTTTFLALGGSSGGTDAIKLTRNTSTNVLEIRDTPTGVVGSGSVAIANSVPIYIELSVNISTSAATLSIYSVSGSVHTLIDTITATGADFTNGGSVTTMHSPCFFFGTTQGIDVGSVWITSGGFYTPGRIVGIPLGPLAAGTYADALWTAAGSASPPSSLAAVVSRNCAAGTNAAYVTAASGSGTGKLSFTVQSLASQGYQIGSAIYGIRPFNTVFMGATQATPTVKHGIIYAASEYETSAMTSLAQLTTVVTGGLPHGRGILYATNGPDSAALTEAKINACELMVNRFADGTTSTSVDAMQLMVYAAYAPTGGWSSDITNTRRGRRFRSAINQ